MAFKMASSKHDRISVYQHFLSSNGALLENSPFLRQKVLSATTCDFLDSYDRVSLASRDTYPSLFSQQERNLKDNASTSHVLMGCFAYLLRMCHYFDLINWVRNEPS